MILLAKYYILLLCELSIFVVAMGVHRDISTDGLAGRATESLGNRNDGNIGDKDAENIGNKSKILATNGRRTAGIREDGLNEGRFIEAK